jgi:hypothetical protein
VQKNKEVTDKESIPSYKGILGSSSAKPGKTSQIAYAIETFTVLALHEREFGKQQFGETMTRFEIANLIIAVQNEPGIVIL